MKIYVCSPLKGDIEKNIEKAKGYCRDIMLNSNGENVAFAPHAFFTQFLDDEIPEHRAIGLKAGLDMLLMFDELWVFGKPSEGMKAEIKWWTENTDKPVRYYEVS